MHKWSGTKCGKDPAPGSGMEPRRSHLASLKGSAGVYGQDDAEAPTQWPQGRRPRRRPAPLDDLEQFLFTCSEEQVTLRLTA